MGYEYAQVINNKETNGLDYPSKSLKHTRKKDVGHPIQAWGGSIFRPWDLLMVMDSTLDPGRRFWLCWCLVATGLG